MRTASFKMTLSTEGSSALRLFNDWSMTGAALPCANASPPGSRSFGTHGEHRAICAADQLFGHASERNSCQPGPTMSADHEQLGVESVQRVKDRSDRWSVENQRLPRCTESVDRLLQYFGQPIARRALNFWWGQRERRSERGTG